ncbi:heparanase isoform X2 [Cololabis saira]|uniref:heparanase isoform X2 n=1 Tax=Cololabis saira TaxID=129043 RepID=UPI002AD2D10C|nr:heparanase isoform X2 [Cololabis saira]
MKSVLLLVLQLFSWTGGSPCCTWFRPPDGPVDRVQDRDQDWDQLQDQVQDLALELDGSAVLHRLDPRYLSVTVDASLAAQEKFMLLLRSEKIRTLARALSPAFLRFGGTRQDFMVFTPEKELQLDPDVSGGLAGPCVSCPGPCVDARLPWWWEERLKADWTRQQQVLVREDLQRKYRRIGFSELTVDMLHSFSSCSGLDLIFGLNALLRTADNSWNSSNADMLLRYCQARRYRLDWELGNEPNSFEKKAGIRVDGYQLGLDFTHLRKMMSESELYRDAGLYGPDVGQPRDHRADILEGFLQSGADAVDALTWHHYYVNGRDTSLEDFLDPEVLDTLALKTNEVMERVKEASPGKAVWLGETSSAYGGGALGLSDTFVAGFIYGGGAVVLLAMNMSKKPARISVPALVSNSTVDAFVLQSEQRGEEGLLSRSVQLNGRLLKMVDDKTLPPLTGEHLPAEDHLQLPAYSLAFFVFVDAGVAACH